MSQRDSLPVHMNILYRSTNQGQNTRSHLLAHLQDGMSRNDLMTASGLTYEQVRRQTKNLVIEGAIESRVDGQGQRRYFWRSAALLSSFLIVSLCSWSVPLDLTFFTDNHGCPTETTV